MRIKTTLLSCLISLAAISSVHAVDFEFTYLDDSAGTLAAAGWMDEQSLFQRNLRAAGKLWGARIASNETIRVLVTTDASRPVAGGTFSNGRRISKAGATVDVYEPGALSRINTGTNPGFASSGFDVKLLFNPTGTQYWMDPSPETRLSEKPANTGDYIWVMQHEIGHGLGMAGARERQAGHANYGLPSTYMSAFDSLTMFLGNGLARSSNGTLNSMVFTGPVSAAVYGKQVDVPSVEPSESISSQNFYHLGSCASDLILSRTLMNGCSTPSGPRNFLTDIDLAVFKDMGYPIVRQDAHFEDTVGVLRAPFVNVPGLGVFDVDLTLTNDVTMEFTLTKANDIPMGVSNPGLFDTGTNLLVIPAVEVTLGGTIAMYRIELKLVDGSNPMRFALVNAVVL
ncbi:MAG: hypothetical protein Q7W55_04750 [Pseudohongiella sp.]|nr:hypothetical protein [Pseudohongiella sp.]